jgi:hypothetical protein
MHAYLEVKLDTQRNNEQHCDNDRANRIVPSAIPVSCMPEGISCNCYLDESRFFILVLLHRYVFMGYSTNKSAIGNNIRAYTCASPEYM